MQPGVQPAEFRIEQHLAAGQQQEIRARVAHLPRERQPAVGLDQPALTAHRLHVRADIAHSAIQVADGQQLHLDVQRDMPPPRLSLQLLLHPAGHRHRSSLLLKETEPAQATGSVFAFVS